MSLVSHWSLGLSSAIELGQAAVRKAAERQISGFVAVYDREGVPLYCQSVGLHYTAEDVSIAQAKIRTVIINQRSTSRLRRDIEAYKSSREDYAGVVETLFSGGIALFHERKFIGAIAFSGATQEGDEDICLTAAREVGVQTDIS